jgi:hypothetical protein
VHERFAIRAYIDGSVWILTIGMVSAARISKPRNLPQKEDIITKSH